MGPRRRDDVNWVEVDGDVVAVDAVDGAVHVLRGAAAVVWRVLDGERLDELDDLVSELTGIGTRQAHADIEMALEALVDAGLVAV